MLRRLLLGYGVPRADVDDVLQEITMGAVMSIRAGRYKPDPTRKPARALQQWLVGIAFRQLGHFHDRAYRRREVLIANPWTLVPEPLAEPRNWLAASEALAALHLLPPWARQVLALAAVGNGVTEIAHALRISIGTAAGRLRRARQHLARKLRRQ
jgi:RNA polymerase sigma-70 factor, ECF subfamily